MIAADGENGRVREGERPRGRFGLFLSIALSCFLSVGRAEEGTLTLNDCYRLALAKSEAVAISEEEVLQAEGRYAQVRAGALPEFGARGTYLFQDTSGVNNSGSNSTFTRSSRPEAKLYARQALFSGFREFAAMKAGKALIAREDLQRRRAEQLLYEDVARAFYAVADLDRRLDILRSMKEASLNRLKELKERLDIGRSRKSELLSAQSQLASLDADLVEARGLRSTSLELLAFFTGRPVAAVADDGAEPAAPVPLEEALRDLPSRPDLEAAARAAEASKHLESSTRRELWPTLNVEGGYYLKRVGFNEPIDWDVLLTAEAPLFRGGAYRGAVKEARGAARVAELERSRALRQAEEEVRVVHSELATALTRAEKLQVAADAADENYKAQVKDYRLGLVDNLDVLAALSALYTARLQHERARTDAKLNAVRLGVAVGAAPAQEEDIPREGP